MTHSPNESDMLKPLQAGSFRFTCHRGIPCFNVCCAKLSLILTPYDILRMKTRLDLSSQVFLERYTDPFMTRQGRFPMVRLKMEKDENRTCPFVTRNGCALYEDRPGACRMYPLGRASAFVGGEGGAREKFFLVEESHCLGLREEKCWTLGEWLAHEGVNEYTEMNDQWLEIVTTSKAMTTQNRTRQLQMFFMASYNLDRFREFLFKSSFFRLFEVATDLREKLKEDDVALMKFAFSWLKFSIFGEEGLLLKSNARSR